MPTNQFTPSLRLNQTLDYLESQNTRAARNLADAIYDVYFENFNMEYKQQLSEAGRPIEGTLLSQGDKVRKASGRVRDLLYQHPELLPDAARRTSEFIREVSIVGTEEGKKAAAESIGSRNKEPIDINKYRGPRQHREERNPKGPDNKHEGRHGRPRLSSAEDAMELPADVLAVLASLPSGSDTKGCGVEQMTSPAANAALFNNASLIT